MPLLHHQPFKLLYLVCFAAQLLLVKIPFWLLISLPRAGRPRPTWSVARCLRLYLLRAIVPLPVTLGLEARRGVTVPVGRDAKLVWVDGVDMDSLTGEVRACADKAGVRPARIPGYWQLRKGAAWTPQARDGETVVYHLHGGAFHLSSAHPAEPFAHIPRGLLAACPRVARTFAVDYRLSASAPFPAAHPFPAALLDCLAGYAYLVRCGVRPAHIVLAGDSAGGNLALALVRHLVAHGGAAARPGRLLLFSPWGDVGLSLGAAGAAGPASSHVRNARSDMFCPQHPVCAYGARSYVGTALAPGAARTNGYISPASPHLRECRGLFKDFPRTYIVAGGAERLLDDSKVIAERIEADCAGEGWVTLDVPPDAIHDFCVYPWHEPERGEALARIARWVDQDQD